MTAKWTIDKVKDAIKEIHGDIITIDESTYIGMDGRCRFIDKEFGEWFSCPDKIINRRQGHKQRSAEKAKKTFLFNYGVDSPIKDKNIKNKIKQTCLEKYGVDNPAKNEEVRNKMSVSMQQTCKDDITVVQKRKDTCFERYGVDNPLKNYDFKKKAQITLMKNFGVIVPAKSEIIMESMKNTCLERYGTQNAMKNHEIAANNARSQGRAKILRHWKTNDELTCIGSYETKTVEYLNRNTIDFKWQSQTFKMPSGKTYRPDVYLVVEDKWIEIKGYFRKDAQEKWDWFSKEHINSELWDKHRLLELNIL